MNSSNCTSIFKSLHGVEHEKSRVVGLSALIVVDHRSCRGKLFQLRELEPDGNWEY